MIKKLKILKKGKCVVAICDLWGCRGGCEGRVINLDSQN